MNRKKTILIFTCFFFLIFSSALLAKSNRNVLRVITLPEAQRTSPVSIEQSILKRRSERTFLKQPLSESQISQILWCAQGITDKEWGLRAAPSAGAVFPLELYIVKDDGIYHYVPDGHYMELVNKNNVKSALAQSTLGQKFVEDAPVNIIIASNHEKSRKKFGSRAERYVYMEAGHVAENIHLQAISLGLGSVPVGAFWDDIAKKILFLPEDEYPLYIIPIGYTP